MLVLTVITKKWQRSPRAWYIYLFICWQFSFTVPDAPGTPRVVEWDGSTATVVWDRPRSDGGARIQGYKIEFKDVQDSVWSGADYLVKDCNYQVSFIVLDVI